MPSGELHQYGTRICAVSLQGLGCHGEQSSIGCYGFVEQVTFVLLPCRRCQWLLDGHSRGWRKLREVPCHVLVWSVVARPWSVYPIWKEHIMHMWIRKRVVKTYNISILSSPTLANKFSCVECQSTSCGLYEHQKWLERIKRTPTTEVCPRKTLIGSIETLLFAYELISLLNRISLVRTKA